MAAAFIQAQPAAPIRLYDGLGKVNFPVTTSSPEAQRYFNQGMGFAYGFNHAAAIASFRAAQLLDPSCAMCFWGEALAYGPNINAPLTPDLERRTSRVFSVRGTRGAYRTAGTPIEA